MPKTLLKYQIALLADLEAGKLDGLMSSEIALLYGISVRSAYQFMLSLHLDGFRTDKGRLMVRNSGGPALRVTHTLWYFA